MMKWWTWTTIISHAAITYFWQNMVFAVGHVGFHATFAECFDAFMHHPDQIAYGRWVAWYHHYVDPQKFTTKWLQYRIAYIDFTDSNQPGVTKAFTLLLPISTMVVAFYLVVSVTQPAPSLFVDVLMFFCWWHVQAVTHEWYHVPSRKRKTYFTIRAVGLFFQFLEAVGIIDSEHHRQHHKADNHTLTETGSFFDMYMPSCADFVVDAYWTWMVQRSQTEDMVGTKSSMNHKDSSSAHWRTRSIPLVEMVDLHGSIGLSATAALGVFALCMGDFGA